MLFEHVKLALKDFGSNKLRTLLSVLGIVIGVASVIAITTLGRSATVSIEEEIEQAGLNMIVVFPGWDSDKEVRRLFTRELGRDMEEVAGVAAVLPVNSAGFLVRNGRNSYDGTVYAVDENFPDMFDYTAARGRFILPEENSRRKSVAVLGSEIADRLFPDGDAVGGSVRVFRGGTSRSFTVVGTMNPRTETMRFDFDTAVYVPYDTYIRRVHNTDSVQRYLVRTGDGEDVLDVADRLSAFFLELTGNADSYRVMSPATIAEMYTGITETMNPFLTGVAAISLLVGGIGIMNIMLVSVAERTREIGIRKALGATPRVIRGQFLTEAVIVTVIGGCTGLAMGTLLSFAGTSMLGWVFAPRLWAFAVAVGFSSMVGVFFGLYPAVRASRLDPVAALSVE